MPTWEEIQEESLARVLELQAAVQRIRTAQEAGQTPDRVDVDLVAPMVAYRGGNLDRLWATEDY